MVDIKAEGAGYDFVWALWPFSLTWISSGLGVLACGMCGGATLSSSLVGEEGVVEGCLEPPAAPAEDVDATSVV